MHQSIYALVLNRNTLQSENEQKCYFLHLKPLALSVFKKSSQYIFKSFIAVYLISKMYLWFCGLKGFHFAWTSV